MLPRANPFRTLQVVRAYWLTSSDGSSARAGGDPKRKLSVLIVISARAPFICDLAARIESATVDHACADASVPLTGPLLHPFAFAANACDNHDRRRAVA